MAKGGTLLLFLSMTAGVRGGCPDAGLLQPYCDCKILDEEYPKHPMVTCSNISSFDDLQKVVDDTLDYPFHVFSIENCTLPHLNASWLVVKQTNKLRLYSSTLISLFDRPLPNSMSLVTEITIQNSTLLRGLQWTEFKPFTWLQNLIVTGVQVRKLGKGFRDNVSPELISLRLVDCKISRLEDGVFQRINTLFVIEMIGCGIKSLKNSYFEGQEDHLGFLYLSNNPIESLPDDMFKGFKVLYDVRIDGAKLKTLPMTLFQHHLKTAGKNLHVEGNPLVCDCGMRWVITTESSFRIYGTCDSPPNLKFKRIQDLEEKDFQACLR